MKNRTEMPSIATRVRERIQEVPTETLFLVRDFLDIASHDTITRTLSWLASEGVIRRVGHGIYDVPRISTFLNKPMPPDPFQVAVAVARRVGEEVAPSEAATANALDISTQVPAKTVYRTNGSKVRRAKVGNHIIELRPTAARYFPENDGEGVIQGLRFIGEGNVSQAMAERIYRTLASARDRTDLFQEARNVLGIQDFRLRRKL